LELLKVLKNLIRIIRVFTLTASYASQIRRVRAQNNPNSKEIITQLKKNWAQASVENLGIELQIKGAPASSEPMLFLGNHLSYLDIPVVMASAPVSFVAKEELSRWPVIGDACRAVGTVFVKRESNDSRKLAILKIGEACLNERQSICLFPSGTTTLIEDKPWRRGAFEIAKTNHLKIQPFRINYFPREIAAFVGDDAFVPHLWRLLGAQNLRAEIEFHDPVEVVNSEESCEHWRRWSQQILQKN
jgi:1-acyl-sn-glycerol-3-phosphate acyltransferase